MKIKVCGQKYPENIQAIGLLAPEYAGFIFYEKSKRFVGESFSTIETKLLPETTKKVGVFVNQTEAYILEKITSCALDLVQLHGEESPAFCASLRSKTKAGLIKVFSIASEEDFDKTQDYSEVSDYFLFDTKTEGYGGSGKAFDWKMLTEYKGMKPYFLSGGIGPEHVHEIAQIHDSRLFALDINSRFEKAPGEKDIEKLRLFFSAIRMGQ